MNAISNLLNSALQLPAPQRAALAHELLLSLEPQNFDADADTAWAREIEVRMAAVAQGNYVAQDWREAIAQIREGLSQETSL